MSSNSVNRRVWIKQFLGVGTLAASGVAVKAFGAAVRDANLDQQFAGAGRAQHTAATQASEIQAEIHSQQPAKKRVFRMALVPSALGIALSQQETIQAAVRFGFEAVEPQPDYLSQLADEEMQRLREQLHAAGLTWSSAGLPVDFRGEEERFLQGLRQLPSYAQLLARAGIDRVGTYIRPTHHELTYLENFRLHVRRFRAMAEVLSSYGVRLSVEYVAPKRSWSAGRFPFIHTLKELRELVAEVGHPAMGYTLDSWHWYTAEESIDDILSLPGKDVLIVHLNDAPAGIPVHEQVDSVRELPLATGVIDMRGFLSALVQIGFEGPAFVEPFKPELRRLPVEQALALVAESVKKCKALVDS